MNTEQERAAFEAACRKHAEESGYDGHERLERNGDGYADPHTQAAWWGWREGLAALQSQYREDALIAAIQDAVDLLGPNAPSCCGCEYEWNHALRVLRAAIDHARRAEGEQ